MADFEGLSLLLSRQTQIQQKLLEIENQKTVALTAGDIEKLDTLMRCEQPLIMQSGSLERRREALQKELGLNDATLSQIIEAYAADGADILKDGADELSGAVEMLKRTTRINAGILNARLSFIGQILSLTGAVNPSLTYTKDGHY